MIRIFITIDYIYIYLYIYIYNTVCQWTFLKRNFDILSCYVVVYARFIDNYSEGYSTIGLIVTESD